MLIQSYLLIINQSGTEVNYDTVQQHQVCCETVSYECVIYCVITCLIKMCQDKYQN